MRGWVSCPLILNQEIKVAEVYYKKPNGEVFKYQAGRMKKSSCDSKYTLCDIGGKATKVEKKATAKKGAK